MNLLRCPHCHFSLHPRATWLTLDYCPRCLAKRHVAEPLRTTDEPTGPMSSFAMTDPAPQVTAMSTVHAAHRPDGAGP
jgi:hypothetical protein